MARLLILIALTLTALVPASASAAVPEGATWTQEFIETADGEQLHVDKLRPKGVSESTRTPVIAVISPYLGHAADGNPSDRFKDLFDGARVFERGYTVVMVDLRGTGGSSGCLDILGPGEQEDIKTAVEWAADAPWSNGRVGMYGKSYDGNTGIAGAAIRPKGLHAVVGQQVVGDRYSGSYSGGVRYLQSVAYPFVSYGTQAEAGFVEEDSDEYKINSLSHSADCQAFLAGHYNPDPDTDFWKARDFVAKGKGSTVPFLMTHGFLDTNTNIGAKAIDFYNGLAGPKRLWLGWWDHVRGNDKVGNRLAMGRTGWFDEVMRFYDEHLKGIRPAVDDPAVVVQGSDGQWRSEQSWPPADAQPLTAPLKTGEYTDDGRNQGSNDAAAGPGGAGNGDQTGAGVWTVSPPLPHDAHIAGIPRAKVNVTTSVPLSNLVVNLYDVAPGGKATMISRGATLTDGLETLDVAMYPTEWQFQPGHRIGVLVSGANAEAWVHIPTNTPVTVDGGTITLPFLRNRRASDQPGAPAPRLATFKADAPFEVAADVLAAATQSGLVPPALLDPVQSVPQPPAAPAPVAQLAVPRAALPSIGGRRGTLRYSVRLDRVKLRTALRRGIRATASCTARCTLAVALTVDRRTARRLKLRSRTVATARITKPFSGQRRITIRFTKAAAKRLRRARTVRLGVAVSARDAIGRRSTSRGTLAL